MIQEVIFGVVVIRQRDLTQNNETKLKYNIGENVGYLKLCHKGFCR